MKARIAVVVATGLMIAAAVLFAVTPAGAAATGGRGATVSGQTATGDLPPTVTLLSPNSFSIYGEPGSLYLFANASDPDGTITKVEFSTAGYSGSPFTLVATVTTAPYAFLLTVPRPTVFVIQATAYDNAGLTATATVRIHVAVSDPPPSRPPAAAR